MICVVTGDQYFVLTDDWRHLISEMSSDLKWNGIAYKISRPILMASSTALDQPIWHDKHAMQNVCYSITARSLQQVLLKVLDLNHQSSYACGSDVHGKSHYTSGLSM